MVNAIDSVPLCNTLRCPNPNKIKPLISAKKYLRNTPPGGRILPGMSDAPPTSPYDDIFHGVARCNAMTMIGMVRERINTATEFSLEVFQELLLQWLIPAEALTRRIILAIAARLPASAWQKKTPQVRSAAAPPLRSVQAPKAQQPRKPRFRMLEPVPGRPRAGGSRKMIGSKTAARRAKVTDDPQPFLEDLIRRTQAVTDAILDPEKEAIRFLRRHHRPGRPRRVPLAFGRPPGLETRPPANGIRKSLSAIDEAARLAWAQLCDSS